MTKNRLFNAVFFFGQFLILTIAVKGFFIPGYAGMRTSSSEARSGHVIPCPQRARLVIAGDLMQHLPQVGAARNRKSGYDYTESFRYVGRIFRDADLAILNLETTLTSSARYTGYPRFRSPTPLAGALQDMGIDVVVLANNHICDNGKPGIDHT
ncbi:MAG: CapA family protein, partial [Tannerella sp.]|nr:CapA family protein [Tannerella sp.]